VFENVGRAEDWSGWRGETGQGISKEKDLPLRWGGKDRENIRWQILLPGQRDKAKQDQNQSSPIVIKGRVVLTASYWPCRVSQKDFPEHHVVCFRVSDGKQLWDTRIEHGPWSLAKEYRPDDPHVPLSIEGLLKSNRWLRKLRFQNERLIEALVNQVKELNNRRCPHCGR
jgi:hypothetical protein